MALYEELIFNRCKNAYAFLSNRLTKDIVVISLIIIIEKIINILSAFEMCVMRNKC